MCCCNEPNINGQIGYKWQHDDVESVRQPSPPSLAENDILLHDEPGRCGGWIPGGSRSGGIDSHCHHYCVVKDHGIVYLLVRHGGGEERHRISSTPILLDTLASLDSNGRYWILNAIHHAASDAANKASEREGHRWRVAAAEKRIKTKKKRGTDQVKVWITTGIAYPLAILTKSGGQ